MARAGLALERLDIELNEAALLEAGSRVARLFETLRSRGVRLVLDDFGTGYSSLGSLHRFPIDLIKIDRSFIAGIPHDPADCAMVEGIISIATRLGLEVAAEGVEREAQRDWLSAHDCHLQQGFLHGGPEDIEALRARLAQTSTSPGPAS
jgi:EAL domain-containing protein (putative c-di-GMP-specific phosphodiesterase class I)